MDIRVIIIMILFGTLFALLESEGIDYKKWKFWAISAIVIAIAVTGAVG